MAEMNFEFDASELVNQIKKMQFEVMASVSDILAGEDVESQLNELGISTEDGKAED